MINVFVGDKETYEQTTKNFPLVVARPIFCFKPFKIIKKKKLVQWLKIITH
jgi:hypothetical protein